MKLKLALDVAKQNINNNDYCIYIASNGQYMTGLKANHPKGVSPQEFINNPTALKYERLPTQTRKKA